MEEGKNKWEVGIVIDGYKQIETKKEGGTKSKRTGGVRRYKKVVSLGGCVPSP